MPPAIAALRRQAGPRRWLIFRRPLPERLAAIRALAELAGNTAEADTALQGLWREALARHDHAILAGIAGSVGALDPGAWAALLVTALDVRSGGGSPDARAAAVRTLGQFSEAAVEALVARLPGPADEGGRWALDVLREIGLGKAAAALSTAYVKASQTDQARLARRLAELSSESWPDLLTLLAALVRRLPPDRRLPDALCEQLGRGTVQQRCVQQWSQARSGDARVLLERYFGYDPKLLS